jgi:hypothetical protein
MQIIEGRNINQLVYKSLQELKSNGFRMKSRNGDVTALFDVSLKFTNPRSRHLNLDGRTNNIFATLAEIIWVMSGRQDINPYLSFFIPRAPQYSDDGENWYAAYGDRMHRNDQIENIINMFKEDGKFTRRATLSIFDSSTDTLKNYKNNTGGTAKDVPCNQWINFFITPDNKLNMKVIQRSGDIIFGTGNINLPEFSVLQEHILQEIQTTYPEVSLGYYNHSVTNLHLYDFNGKQAIPIMSNEQILTRDNNIPCIFPTGVSETKNFFGQVVELFSDAIDGTLDLSNMCLQDYIDIIFFDIGLTKNNNLIFEYIKVVGHYISIQKGYLKEPIEYKINDEFTVSLKNNFFNTKEKGGIVVI